MPGLPDQLYPPPGLTPGGRAPSAGRRQPQLFAYDLGCAPFLGAVG